MKQSTALSATNADAKSFDTIRSSRAAGTADVADAADEEGVSSGEGRRGELWLCKRAMAASAMRAGMGLWKRLESTAVLPSLDAYQNLMFLLSIQHAIRNACRLLHSLNLLDVKFTCRREGRE